MSSVSRAFSICFCLGMRRDRAHVVQPVGELDQDDPDVRGHRDHHLAVVLGLRLVAGLEGQPGQLGDAVDEAGDLLAERLAAPPRARPMVSSTVSCSSAAHSVSVSSRIPAQILATPTGWMMKSSPDLPALVGVVHAGVDERLLDAVAVDRDRGLRRRAPRRSRTGRRAAAARSRVSSARSTAPSHVRTVDAVDRRPRGRRTAPTPERVLRRRRAPPPPVLAGLRLSRLGDGLRCSGIVVRPRIAVRRPCTPASARAPSARRPRSPGPADPGRG